MLWIQSDLRDSEGKLFGYKRLSGRKDVQHNECERVAERSATLSHGIFVNYGQTIRRHRPCHCRSGRGRAWESGLELALFFTENVPETLPTPLASLSGHPETLPTPLVGFGASGSALPGSVLRRPSTLSVFVSVNTHVPVPLKSSIYLQK